MLLPNHAEAIIEVGKLRDFLLDPDHEHSWDRARILIGLGFERERWQELEEAIRLLIASNDAIPSPRAYDDPRYIVFGDLVGPHGSRHFMTVWEFRRDLRAPRFLSAYPRTHL